MSFQLPQNVPSFSSAQRSLEDSYWRASATRSQGNGALNGYGLSQSGNVGGLNKLNSFFDGGLDLPMYKDKPYFAPRRTGPGRRRKVIFGILGLVLIGFLWWRFGGSQSSLGLGKGAPNLKGEDLWTWLQNSQKEEGATTTTKAIDWERRRDKVRDAFIISWDGYEKYAWGKWECPRLLRRT